MAQRSGISGSPSICEIVGALLEGVLGIVTELLSFGLMLFGRERKSLHDHVAGTVVLHDPGKGLGTRPAS